MCELGPLVKFRFSYQGQGVVLHETDDVESYLLIHGPYADQEEAWAAMQYILEYGHAPEPQDRIEGVAAL